MKGYKIISHKIWIFFLLLFLVLVFLLWGYREFYYINGETPQDVFQSLWLETISAIFTILVVGIFFEVYLRKNNDDLDKKRIIEAIQLDKKMLMMFSNAQKENFIENNIKSIIGEQYGRLLFYRVLKGYLDISLIYREEFQYDVELYMLKNDIKINNYALINKRDYFALNQSLVSTKHFSKNRKDINLKIVFAFNEHSLDFWLNDEAVFMREILWVENSTNLFSSMHSNELYNFVKDSLMLKINFFDIRDDEFEDIKDYSVNFVNHKLAQGIEVNVSSKRLKSYLSNKNNTLYYKAKVSFSIPYSTSINRFYFVIAEPTVSPKFTIKFSNLIKEVDYITYFAQKDDTFKISHDPHINKYYIQSKEIIYPRSGVIFFW